MAEDIKKEEATESEVKDENTDEAEVAEDTEEKVEEVKDDKEDQIKVLQAEVDKWKNEYYKVFADMENVKRRLQN